MKEPKIIIDVRNMPDIAERPKKVSAGLDKIESGEYAQIIADDEKMLKLAPRMMKAIGKADFIKSWKGEDAFYHTLIRKNNSPSQNSVSGYRKNNKRRQTSEE